MRIVLLVVYICLTGTGLYAQSGGWRMYIKCDLLNSKYRKTGDGSAIILSAYNDWGSYVFGGYQNLNKVKKHRWVTAEFHSDVLSAERRIPFINVYTKLGRNNASNPDGKDIPIYNLMWNHEPIRYKEIHFCSMHQGCNPQRYVFQTWEGNMYIYIYPTNLSIAYFNDEGSLSQILPTHDKIRIKAPEGFDASVYNWEYSDDNVNYTSFSYPFQGRSELHLSGVDIYGLNSAMNKAKNGEKTYIRLKYQTLGGWTTTNRLTLTNMVSAPHIQSVDTIPNTCYGDNTAAIRITFDRALYAGEKLQMYLNGADQGSVDTFLENNTLAFQSLYAGDYTFQVSGYYTNSVTFSGSLTHRDTIRIHGPAPVSIPKVVTRHVSCYEGNDGLIHITAQGGAKAYKLMWLKQGQSAVYDTIPFPQATDEEYYLDKLSRGVYQFQLQDQNGCFERDEYGEVKVHRYEIKAPAAPLRITTRIVEHPKGFQRKDGRIELEMEGGTPFPDGSYRISWTNINGDTIASVRDIVIGEPVKNSLLNKGDGTYILEVTDANYTDAYSSCNANCIIRDTFILREPPKLIVSLRESRYVSCFGESDGEITAHAEGGIPLTGIGMPYRYQWFKLEGGMATHLPQVFNDSIYGELPTGSYQVQVRDTYDNVGESEVFFLESPTELTILAKGSQVLCNGEANGTASVKAAGGTPPYLFEWNTGAMVDSLYQLPVGRYWVKVTDSRGCYKDTTVAVVSPDALELSFHATDPVCHESRTGRIEAIVAGGRPPYSYQWNTGDTAPVLNDLPAGQYSLLLKDANACVAYLDVVLYDPEPLRVSLGGNRTLCNEQSLRLAPEVDDPATTFYWWSDRGFSSSEREVVLSEEGKYWLEITDSKTCKAIDSLYLKVEQAVISAEWVVASSVFLNDTVVLVNISDPAPESSEWLVEDSPYIRVSGQDDHFLRLVFSEEGQYTIGLRSHVGQCRKELYKTITVVGQEVFPSTGEPEQSLIKHFSISPNPTSGIFSARVELEKESAIRLRLLNLSTGQALSDGLYTGSKEYLVPYNLQLSSGVYALVLETVSGSMVLKVIAY